MSKIRTIRSLAIAALAGVAVLGLVGLMLDEPAAAKKPGGGGSCPQNVCPRPCIACIDVYDPVTCSDGNTYSNSCYAYVACATGCTPSGGGPVSVD